MIIWYWNFSRHGSDVRDISNFENRYAGVTQVRLEENFRSSEGVVAVARELIRQVVRRLPKE
jgi:DNA helicase-2/ATP-dependent DNA helicase PcrA